MKRLFLWIIIAIMAIPLLSCSDEEPAPPAAIDFVGGQGGQDDSSLNFSHQSSTQSVVFSSNYDWTATPSDEWIKVTPESGKAGEKCEIVVSLDANDTYEKRSGSIVINAKELNVVLTVSQEQNNAIILSTPTVNLPQAGGAFTVKLKANIDYEYEIKADWIKSVETRALAEHSLRFEAEANPSYDKREGEIVIKGDGFSETVTVTQAQTAVISLSTTEQNFDSEGGTFEVEVEHSVDYDVKISADWVTQIESRAVETTTLHFAVAENTTYGERKATITIKGEDITETITVVQTQNNAIILSTPTVNLPQAGGAFTVKLKANIDYEYEIKADWIKSVETRALTEHSLRFEAEANPSFDKRVGEIIIKGDGFSETVTVTQAQTAFISLSTTQQDFAWGGGEFSVEVQYNVDYKVEISDSWVTQIESRAVKTSTLRFAVAENTTYEERKATITIKGGDIEETITIKQSMRSIPSNELRYTTTNGDFLSPYRKYVFGANIVSNTYNSNGQGVIIFDAPVTSIGQEAFRDCTSLTSITIPDSVTSIGDSAFRGCTSLTSITIPDSVTSIGLSAFNGCTSLTSITIPDSVTKIEWLAFYNCTSLTSITIGNGVTSIGERAFYGCTGELIVNGNIPMASSYEYGAFYGSKFTKVTIGDNVTSIGFIAFDGCTSLTRVDITDLSAWCKISFVGYKANPLYNGAKLYLNGGELTDITIPSDITSIGDYAFNGCSSLTSVTIPDSVTSIGNATFSNCTSLTSVTIGNSVTSIGDGAFDGCTSLTSVTIPDSVTSIGNAAFRGCTSLTSVTIGNSVTSIGWYAFYNCTGELIVNCNIPSASSYDYGAFYGSNFTKVTIGNSVTSIGDYAFDGCTSLISVTIPDGVTSIGGGAFDDCTSLTSVTIGNGVTSIGNLAFYECTSLTSVTIGDSVTSIGGYAFEYCTSLTSITIPDSVTSIGNDAFKYCTSLTSITIGNGVTSIGEDAFSNTSLTSVTIPDSVTSIGGGAFSYCDSLTSLTIGSGVTSIGQEAFYDCTGELTVNCNIPMAYSYGYGAFYGSKFTKVTIGDNVTSIGNHAFYECTSLTSLTIGSGVTSIGGSAFNGCTSLTSVAIPDSVTSIGISAFYQCTSLKEIYCKPTTPPTGDSAMFSDNAWGRKIYVPRNSVEAYKSALYWSSYASYIEGYDF